MHGINLLITHILLFNFSNFHINVSTVKNFTSFVFTNKVWWYFPLLWYKVSSLLNKRLRDKVMSRHPSVNFTKVLTSWLATHEISSRSNNQEIYFVFVNRSFYNNIKVLKIHKSESWADIIAWVTVSVKSLGWSWSSLDVWAWEWDSIQFI